MARQNNSFNDKYWPEVKAINSYAIFMGYLSMGVRGLGLLVLTWTTVVLLGGFVSMLQTKEFWCLTTITLVQTAGVFDFLLKEKASDVGSSLKGLLFAVGAAVVRPFKKDTNTHEKNSSKPNKEDKGPSTARVVVGIVLMVVQVLVLAIVLCPLAVLYGLGLYLSAGISLWRLIQHDYGNVDGGANLKPALNLMYSLVVAQGVVYGYRDIYILAARTGLVERVAQNYFLETDLVSEYLEETVAGCMKDPSFARGRNMVTYGVDLLVESKSRFGYISGVLILGTVTLYKEMSLLMKELLTRSVSFSYMVQRLVETFGPSTSPYNTEIRMRAARIVANVAGSIHLDQFPTQGLMIQCISSLLDTSEEYSWRPEGYERRLLCHRDRPDSDRPLPKEYERDWLLADEEELWYLDGIGIPTVDYSKTWQRPTGTPLLHGYKGLVVQGLRILQKLAINVDNCRFISNKQGLLSKAMAPLISNQQLHSGDDHDEWCIMAEESLEVMQRLMATPPGETQTKLSNEISGNTQAIIRALEVILGCDKCEVLVKRQAIEVLLALPSVDTHKQASIMSGRSSSSIMFLWILLHISLLPDCHFGILCGSTHLAKKSSDTKRLAVEKLKAMLQSSETTEGKARGASALRSVGDLIGSLARTVAGGENNAYRIHAAMILANLCGYYTKEDEHLKQLKKAMTDVMPEVLKQIVCRLTREEAQAAAQVTEAQQRDSGRHGS